MGAFKAHSYMLHVTHRWEDCDLNDIINALLAGLVSVRCVLCVLCVLCCAVRVACLL